MVHELTRDALVYAYSTNVLLTSNPFLSSVRLRLLYSRIMLMARFKLIRSYRKIIVANGHNLVNAASDT